MAKVTLKQGVVEIPTEVIADSIQQISDGMKRLRAGRLNDRAIILLIHHASNVGQREIKDVLAAMESLAVTYLRKRP